MHPNKPLLRLTLAWLVVTAMLSLPGCAVLSGILAINALGTIALGVNGPVADETREQEVSRQTYPYAAGQVYDTLLHVVERDDRKIVDRQAETYSMRVSYPFSWLHNNWGGVITISCVANASDDGAESTTVIVVGGARDAIRRVRTIGDQVLTDLDEGLHKQP